MTRHSRPEPACAAAGTGRAGIRREFAAIGRERAGIRREFAAIGRERAAV